jgi:hypothetical protein
MEAAFKNAQAIKLKEKLRRSGSHESKEKIHPSWVNGTSKLWDDANCLLSNKQQKMKNLIF